MAAVMSADMDNTDKVVTLVDECQRMGLLCRRLDLNKLNRRVLEALIRSGEPRQFRRQPRHAHEPAAGGDAARRAEHARHAAGRWICSDWRRSVRRHRAALEPAAAAADPTAGFQPDWSEAIRLAGERETLGLYLTGHPINRYEKDLKNFVSSRIVDLLSDRPPTGSGPAERGFYGGKQASVAGYVHEVRKRGTRVSAVLDDRTGRIEVTFFEDVFNQYRELIVKDALLLVEGSLRFDEFSDAWRLAAKRVTELDRLRENQAHRIVLLWPGTSAAPGSATDALLKRLGGRAAALAAGTMPRRDSLRGRACVGGARTRPDWRVRASRQLLDELEALFGAQSVRVVYGPAPGSSPSSAAG
jgi:DNA polymerase-3 subunit alpha